MNYRDLHLIVPGGRRGLPQHYRRHAVSVGADTDAVAGTIQPAVRVILGDGKDHLHILQRRAIGNPENPHLHGMVGTHQVHRISGKLHLHIDPMLDRKNLVVIGIGNLRHIGGDIGVPGPGCRNGQGSLPVGVGHHPAKGVVHLAGIVAVQGYDVAHRFPEPIEDDFHFRPVGRRAGFIPHGDGERVLGADGIPVLAGGNAHLRWRPGRSLRLESGYALNPGRRVEYEGGRYDSGTRRRDNGRAGPGRFVFGGRVSKQGFDYPRFAAGAIPADPTQRSRQAGHGQQGGDTQNPGNGLSGKEPHSSVLPLARIMRRPLSGNLPQRAKAARLPDSCKSNLPIVSPVLWKVK